MLMFYLPFIIFEASLAMLPWDRSRMQGRRGQSL
jgi:hypothetical protein